MAINKPPKDRMMRSGDARNKKMTEKLKVKILKPFMLNGKLLEVGDEVEMNASRAVNHMRVGDVERDEDLIAEIKANRVAAANAARSDAEGDW